MNLKLTTGLLAFLVLPVVLWAVTGNDLSPDEYYQSALQAYLNGDIDQSILLDSKSLQMNPQNQKAQALLTVLIGEKDAAQKTVIWIGGKPTTVEAAAPISQTTLFKVPILVNRGNFSKVPKLKLAKTQELENRIQTMVLLLQRDSTSQSKELTSAQVQMTHRLDEISINLREVKTGLKYGTILFLLALIIACLALWNSWRTRREMKRQAFKGRLEHSREDRVVNLR